VVEQLQVVGAELHRERPAPPAWHHSDIELELRTDLLPLLDQGGQGPDAATCGHSYRTPPSTACDEQVEAVPVMNSAEPIRCAGLPPCVGLPSRVRPEERSEARPAAGRPQHAHDVIGRHGRTLPLTERRTCTGCSPRGSTASRRSSGNEGRRARDGLRLSPSERSARCARPWRRGDPEGACATVRSRARGFSLWPQPCGQQHLPAAGASAGSSPPTTRSAEASRTREPEHAHGVDLEGGPARFRSRSCPSSGRPSRPARARGRGEARRMAPGGGRAAASPRGVRQRQPGRARRA